MQIMTKINIPSTSNKEIIVLLQPYEQIILHSLGKIIIIIKLLGSEVYRLLMEDW